MSAPGNGWNLARFLIGGYLALGVLVFGLGAWAAASRISGAVIASGVVEVQGNRQVVQHPIGGVIAEIGARDGDAVAEGAVLIRLDGQALVTELDIVEGQWFEILARKSRLAAERDGLEAIVFDDDLAGDAGDAPQIAALKDAQVQQFEARRRLQADESRQLEERQFQIARQIEGLESLRAATASQIALLEREIEGQETLLAQGLTQVTRVLTPQRELAGLRGNEGQVEATIAENRGRIAEIEVERVRLEAEIRAEALSELRDLEFREIELRERRRDLIERIEALELRAPVAGVVYGSTADTLRGVIRPAEPVMSIVPRDTPLIVRARVEPIQIDHIHLGQEAALVFAAFDARTTPDIRGEVTAVSADAIVDPGTGARYYRVDIEVEMPEAAADLRLLPGMPVEAFIRTAERSPMSYLLRPLATYFNRAFREG